VEDGEQCVRIRLCTTLRERSVLNAKPAHQQHMFLLADNRVDVVPHNGTRLAKMVNSAKFSKRTYVNLSRGQDHPIEYKYLAPYLKTSMVFDHDAIEMIKQCRPY
jgi:hypothetical protein